MVPVRRHARYWIAYFARKGLVLGSIVGCSLRKIERRYDEGDPNHTGKKTPPGPCYKEYEHPTDEEHRTAEQFNWEREGFLFLTTTIAVIVAAFYARGAYVESGRQAIAAEGQLSEAVAQTNLARKSSRPYVFPVVIGDKLNFQPPNGPPNIQLNNQAGTSHKLSLPILASFPLSYLEQKSRY